ncbi:transcriptional regulator [Halobaculum sp. MBLA0143]|uniref:HVO_A0114 family putative DNA-binding protein n=1 Tax=Halobaculum sp. MBLA0143 TaxID=3079933 RepID=UPI003524D3F3
MTPERVTTAVSKLLTISTTEGVVTSTVASRSGDRMNDDTLLVTVESLTNVERRARDATTTALADTDTTAGGSLRRLSFPDPASLFAVFSPEAVTLLRLVADEEPASVADAARLADEDRETVAETLERLATHEVVAFDGDRPVVSYETVRIELGVGTVEDTERVVEA